VSGQETAGRGDRVEVQAEGTDDGASPRTEDGEAHPAGDDAGDPVQFAQADRGPVVDDAPNAVVPGLHLVFFDPLAQPDHFLDAHDVEQHRPAQIDLEGGAGDALVGGPGGAGPPVHGAVGAEGGIVAPHVGRRGGPARRIVGAKNSLEGGVELAQPLHRGGGKAPAGVGRDIEQQRRVSAHRGVVAIEQRRQILGRSAVPEPVADHHCVRFGGKPNPRGGRRLPRGGIHAPGRQRRQRVLIADPAHIFPNRRQFGPLLDDGTRLEFAHQRDDRRPVRDPSLIAVKPHLRNRTVMGQQFR